MKHILVAMDLGASADRAFERALQLAGVHEARLTLAHVIDVQSIGYGEFTEVLTKGAIAKLGRHWAALPEAVATRFRHVIKVGSPWETILALSNEAACDLIVLGLHRVSPLKDMFRGTTAERIIRNSSRPVLVVKDKPAGPYRKVIVATDFSPCSSHAFQAALDLAPSADFQLLHIFETPFPVIVHFRPEELQAYRQERVDRASTQAQLDLERFLSSHSGQGRPEIKAVVVRGDVVSGIASTVEANQPDLLVLGTHGRSGIIGALIGSVAGSFLNDPSCDLLVSH